MPILRGSCDGIRGLLQIWWRAPCGGFLPLLALRGNSHRGEFEGHVERNFTVHGWSCSCFWEFTITNYIPGTLNNMLFYSIDVWWNTHLSCNFLDLSNLNNHFQVDVSGSRYLYVYKVSPYQIYQFVNRVTLEPSHSPCFCWYFLGRIGGNQSGNCMLNTDKHSLDHFSLKLAILRKKHVFMMFVSIFQQTNTQNQWHQFQWVRCFVSASDFYEGRPLVQDVKITSCFLHITAYCFSIIPFRQDSPTNERGSLKK